MSIKVNQHNYATPLSSAATFGGGQSTAQDKKYLTLHDNVLDGSYCPISGDVGIWGNVLSDANGKLSTPFVIDVLEDLSVNAFLITGSKYAYPVDFTITFFNGMNIVHVLDVVDNASPEYTVYFPTTVAVTRYVLFITRISSANTVARVLNAYSPAYVKRSDAASISLNETSTSGAKHTLHLYDVLCVDTDSAPARITNILDAKRDTAVVASVGRSVPTNVHTRMKEPSRRIYGKVYITYTDPMLESITRYTSSSTAHGSDLLQITDGNSSTNPAFFTLHDNDLSGNYVVIGENDHVGWMSGQISGPGGVFESPAPYVRFDFAERPVANMSVVFDDSRDALAKDFTIEYIRANGEVVKKEFVDNALTTVSINETITNVVAVIITVTRINREGYPVTILEVPVMSTLLYVGYKDRSDLISIDLLEELTYDDEVEALGGISANEVTITLNNSDKHFFFNNPASPVATQLKRNRKIVPWLGVEIVPGEIEWYTLGTFWSYSWDVPVEGLTAKVVGFDTIGLLDTTSFTKHPTLINHSIGQLIEYVLEDAKQQLPFIKYNIDATLYDTYIPYAWFEPKSHTAALRKISSCYPIHIYCDRSGTICAAPQKLHLDYHYDTWANNTNVISKKYSSLYTVLPNIINVTVHSPRMVLEESLTTDELPFDVSLVPTRTLNFSKPYVSDIVVTVDCDPTVQYTYEAYSWGIEFVFSGVGEVRSIACSGKAVDLGHSATITRRDANSVMLNGAVTRDISSDFIQTSTLAASLIARLLELSEQDKYDANVDYRGDIALSINDPIILLDGIAPVNKYNIKRHELFWNGSLTGSAYLNT